MCFEVASCCSVNVCRCERMLAQASVQLDRRFSPLFFDCYSAESRRDRGITLTFPSIFFGSFIPYRELMLCFSLESHPRDPVRPVATVSAPSQYDVNAMSSSERPGISELKRKISGSPPPVKKLRVAKEDKARHLDYTHVTPGWLDVSGQTDADQRSLQLTYHKGDMFADAPPGTMLVHACNTQGYWGAGIAKAFKQQYPKAYADHHRFCVKDHNKSNPVPTGSAQLLVPQDDNKKHWIGCVFTSAKYGKSKDKPDKIISSTVRSMQMLLELVSQVDDDISTIRTCKINSGKFGVAWESTEEAITSIKLKPVWRAKIEVWEPEG